MKILVCVLLAVSAWDSAWAAEYLMEQCFLPDHLMTQISKTRCSDGLVENVYSDAGVCPGPTRLERPPLPESEILAEIDKRGATFKILPNGDMLYGEMGTTSVWGGRDCVDVPKLRWVFKFVKQEAR